VSLKNPPTREFGKPQSGSLSTILGSFKSAVTKQAHEEKLFEQRSLWHPRFHDHIIRDDVDRFFIERYIELNPIMWELDSNNSDGRKVSVKDLETALRKAHHLDGEALQRLMKYEIEYRHWSGR